jgi:hypothetical protein
VLHVSAMLAIDESRGGRFILAQPRYRVIIPNWNGALEINIYGHAPRGSAHPFFDGADGQGATRRVRQYARAH